jgi:hypothetical protein
MRSANVTPDERAKDWFTIAPTFRTKDRLAAEVRAAENDALERAACLALENDAIARAIRALKHATV